MVTFKVTYELIYNTSGFLVCYSIIVRYKYEFMKCISASHRTTKCHNKHFKFKNSNFFATAILAVFTKLMSAGERSSCSTRVKNGGPIYSPTHVSDLILSLQL